MRSLCNLLWGGFISLIPASLLYVCAHINRPVQVDGYTESGPFNPMGFEMSNADADAVQARRIDFMQRLNAVHGDRIPPSKRRVFDRIEQSPRRHQMD